MHFSNACSSFLRFSKAYLRKWHLWQATLWDQQIEVVAARVQRIVDHCQAHALNVSKHSRTYMVRAKCDHQQKHQRQRCL